MFTTPLIVESERRPGLWIVRAPLVWECAKLGSVIVPEGFITDLASIPRMARAVPGFDPLGLSRRPAVLHDWLYAKHLTPRLFADTLLYDALRAEGVSFTIARVYYRAVRMFGAEPWERAPRRLSA